MPQNLKRKNPHQGHPRLPYGCGSVHCLGGEHEGTIRQKQEGEIRKNKNPNEKKVLKTKGRRSKKRSEKEGVFKIEGLGVLIYNKQMGFWRGGGHQIGHKREKEKLFFGWGVGCFPITLGGGGVWVRKQRQPEKKKKIWVKKDESLEFKRFNVREKTVKRVGS